MPVVCLWAVEKAARQRSDDESSTLATLRAAALDMAFSVECTYSLRGGGVPRLSYQIEGQDPCTAPWKRQSGRREEEKAMKKQGGLLLHRAPGEGLNPAGASVVDRPRCRATGGALPIRILPFNTFTYIVIGRNRTARGRERENAKREKLRALFSI